MKNNGFLNMYSSLRRLAILQSLEFERLTKFFSPPLRGADTLRSTPFSVMVWNGMDRPSSSQHNVPQMTIRPPAAQINNDPPTLPVPASTFGGTVKIPDPIVRFNTKQTRVNRPRRCFAAGATSNLCASV
jgi:hypothetical protein